MLCTGVNCWCRGLVLHYTFSRSSWWFCSLPANYRSRPKHKQVETEQSDGNIPRLTVVVLLWMVFAGQSMCVLCKYNSEPSLCETVQSYRSPDSLVERKSSCSCDTLLLSPFWTCSVPGSEILASWQSSLLGCVQWKAAVPQNRTLEIMGFRTQWCCCRAVWEAPLRWFKRCTTNK